MGKRRLGSLQFSFCLRTTAITNAAGRTVIASGVRVVGLAEGEAGMGDTGTAEVTIITGVVVGTSADWYSSDGECADVPPGVVIVMSTMVPGGMLAGTIAIISKVLRMVKFVAGISPKYTAVAPSRPFPLMVTVVPPVIGP